MRIFRAISLLLFSLSCDSAQVYTTQNTEDAVAGISAPVVWRYTVLMDRMLVRDFDPATLSNPKFVNAFTQKTMAVVSDRLTKDMATAVKVGAIISALQGKFPRDSAVGKGLKKIVDAALALAMASNPNKAQSKQLNDDLTAALTELLSDAESRQALATQGSFISSQLKGPPDIMAQIFSDDFINAILAIKESETIRKVIDIPIFFDEMIKTMHTVLNDAELMAQMSDPAIVGDAGAVMSSFFKLYKKLQGNKDSLNVNTIKTQVETMLRDMSTKRLAGAKIFSAALWSASRPVQFKNLKHTDACDSNAWQAVQDLDGESLVKNLPAAAITALSLCRINARSCDAWGNWGNWTPATDTACEGSTLTQTRTRQRTCPVPCNGADCDSTDSEIQDVDGTKVCSTAPVCENSCNTACTNWKVWESKAWSPAQDTVCGGQKMRQRRSRSQSRTCTNLCENTDCPTFQILTPSKRTVEGTRHCPPQPAPTCKCCNDQNNEITSCPTDSRLAWNSDTCSCGTCSKDAIMSCGGIYSSGKLYDDRALDANCNCYYKTTKLSWITAILYGATKGKELLDVSCALQNVNAFKDNAQGRSIRAALWDDGCVQPKTFVMGCRTTNATEKRQKFIDFHNRTLTSQTSEGYWGIGCSQVFSDRQAFERRMMRTILICGDHHHSIAAWEQIGKPPHFDRIYKIARSTFLERKIPEWGRHLQMCESDYQKNRPARIEN